MTDKERLIELLDGYYSEEGNVVTYFTVDDSEKIADYLFENGVILLPCKIGDTIYVLAGSSEIIVEFIVCGIHYTKESRYGKLKDNQYLVVESRFCHGVQHININSIGKTVFLNYEEAERALKEGDNNG